MEAAHCWLTCPEVGEPCVFDAQFIGLLGHWSLGCRTIGPSGGWRGYPVLDTRLASL